MKYLLNVPLAVGALAQALFAYLALMSAPWPNWEDGPSRGAMAYIMFQPAVLSWLMMLIAGIPAVFTDAFDWVPIAHRGRRRLALLVATLFVIATLGVCMFVALGASAAAGSSEDVPADPIVLIIGQIGGTIVPLLAMAWLAWLIDSPADRRDLAVLRLPALGTLGFTTAIGGVLGLQMLRDEIVIERATALEYQQMSDERDAGEREGIAKLTDADPLPRWLGYTDPLMLKDVRKQAVQRLATRPTLEPDLADALQSSDPDIVDGALRAIALVDFKPTAALEAPLRAALGNLPERIRVSRTEQPFDDEYVDRWFSSQWADALVAVEKLAASAGVDLRDVMSPIVQTTSEIYPKSRSAKSFPRDLAAADRKITDALAASHHTP